MTIIVSGRVDLYVPLAWLADRALVPDRRFGSANYMPLANGSAYRVVIT